LASILAIIPDIRFNGPECQNRFDTNQRSKAGRMVYVEKPSSYSRKRLVRALHTPVRQGYVRHVEDHGCRGNAPTPIDR
jgi:hypothetical protein